MRSVLTILLIFFISLGAQENNATTNTPTEDIKTDWVVVKGNLLQGKVVALTSEYLTFETTYGKGSILISFADIDMLKTQHSYHIFYNAKESNGKIVGIRDHKWLIAQKDNTQELIEISEIDRFIISTNENSSFSNRMRNLFPYVTGSVDLKIELENKDPITNELDLSARIEYLKKRDRLLFNGLLEHDTKKPEGESEVKTKDEYVLNIDYNRYFDAQKEYFIVGAAGLEHDGMRQIEHRGYGAIGIGYRFISDKSKWLDIALGAGGVNEKFTNYDEDLYAAIYTNAEALYTFKNGVFIRGNIRYMPSVLHNRAAWLFRAGVSVTIPISQSFAFRFALTDVDDNNPSPEIGNNKITTDIGVSFVF